jgi:hypothetical protein
MADLFLKHTTFKQIEGAFRRQNGISPDNMVTLIFDGEPLKPEIVVGETEIIDVDEHALLEVHVK